MGNKNNYTLGDRMKEYENVSNIRLIRNMPVVIRLDMCAGHTFTRGFVKPFDSIYMKTMQQTMEALCKEIAGTVFGYTQSDEITLVLCDYKKMETSPWFDNRVQKMCSVSASKTGRFFNKFFKQNVEELIKQNPDEDYSLYVSRFDSADFDSRVFNVPKFDVVNAVLWRQKDAERNSVQMLAQSLYKHRELEGINCNDLQNKMFTEKGINWSELPTPCKRGSACIKDADGKWFIDYDMPIIGKQRDYVDSLINFNEFEVD